MAYVDKIKTKDGTFYEIYDERIDANISSSDQGKFLGVNASGAIVASSVKKTTTCTLPTNMTLTGHPVDVTGVTASNTVFVSPDPDSTDVYGTAGIYCSAQASGKLTFKAKKAPTAQVTVNVVIFD